MSSGSPDVLMLFRQCRYCFAHISLDKTIVALVYNVILSLIFHFRGCSVHLGRLVAIHFLSFPFISPQSGAAMSHWICQVVWLPGAEQTFSALSLGLPTFLRSQKIPWAGNWDKNFFFFIWVVLAKPISWPHWWQEMVLAQERKWGWAGVFGGQKVVGF